MKRSWLTLGASLTLVHFALVVPLAVYVIGTALGRGVADNIIGGTTEPTRLERAGELLLLILLFPIGLLPALLPKPLPEPVLFGVVLLSSPLWGFSLAWVIRQVQGRFQQRMERQRAQEESVDPDLP